jgi:hypothetical protein
MVPCAAPGNVTDPTIVTFQLTISMLSLPNRPNVLIAKRNCSGVMKP